MMELQLNRVDYMQAGATSAKCMRLIQKGKKENLNKVAVADNMGIVHVFGMKKNEIQTAFKSLPGSAVTRLELGGPSGQPKDRLFVSSASVVRGYSKKGKQFLDFNTNITETIQNMFVEGAELFITGNYIFHHYHDCKDLNYYLCSEKINDVICLPTIKMPDITPILACDDRVIRILQDSDVACQFEISGPPKTLCLNLNDGGDLGDEIIYGTADGHLGLAQISRLIQQQRWELDNDKRSGGIVCLDNYDITGDGLLDLLVGRDDGLIEVYAYNEADEPVKRYSNTCSESVTSIQGGQVASPDYHEIVISTYAGWVTGFTTEPGQRSFGASSSRITENKTTHEKIIALRKELDELQKHVQIERDRYQSKSQSSTAISAVPKFNINDKFTSNKEDASYTLSIEVQTAIDNLLLQSDVPVDLLDVDKNSAVVSLSACNAEDGNFLLATYRCQANTTRMELKLRSIEGQYGTIQAYITPKLQPKVCQVRQYQIKPLSLHQRSHTFDERRPLNKVCLTGNFSMAEIHAWVSYCLPELPERTPNDGITFYFVSTFLDTNLECSYKRGEALFRSDNISTISILKDVLTKEATKKGIRLEMTYDINDDSIPHVLNLIHPKLEYQLLLAKKVQLIEALKEVQMQENNAQVLSDEYQQILKDADKLQTEFKRQPCHLERLYGMITDLYIDSYKFKGQTVKHKVQQLMVVLDNYNLQDLIEFFHASV